MKHTKGLFVAAALLVAFAVSTAVATVVSYWAFDGSDEL